MQSQGHILSKTYVISYGILLASTGIFFGYGVGIFNAFFDPFIKSGYPEITDHDNKMIIKSNVNFSFLIGGTLACIISSSLISIFGRYKFLLFICLGQVLSLLLIMIKNFGVLYTSRGFCGFFSCASTFICPLMIKELIPAKYSAQIGNSFYIFLTGGILISNLISAPWMGDYWQLFLALPIFLEFPKFILYLAVFRLESPKTIIERNSNPEEELFSNFAKIYNEEGCRIETQKIMKENEESKAAGPAVTFGSLFTDNYRLAFLLALMLNFLNQATGINFLVLYSTDIFKKLKVNNPELMTSVLGILNFCGAIYITLFGKNHGKRSLLIFGLGAQAFAYFLFLLGLVFENGHLVLAGCFLYMTSFSVSLGGTLYPYLADIVPAVGLSIAGISQWFIACLVAKFALVIMSAFGEFNTFYSFMVISFVGCIVFSGFSIDTEGKSDLQIKNDFKRKKFMD